MCVCSSLHLSRGASYFGEWHENNAPKFELRNTCSKGRNSAPSLLSLEAPALPFQDLSKVKEIHKEI